MEQGGDIKNSSQVEQVFQVQPASTSQQQEHQTMAQLWSQFEQQNNAEKEKPQVEYKQYDPYCNVQQFNVILGGVIFDVVNPPETWEDAYYGMDEDQEDQQIEQED